MMGPGILIVITVATPAFPRLEGPNLAWGLPTKASKETTSQRAYSKSARAQTTQMVNPIGPGGQTFGLAIGTGGK